MKPRYVSCRKVLQILMMSFLAHHSSSISSMFMRSLGKSFSRACEPLASLSRASALPLSTSCPNKHVQTCQILSKHVQTNINCFHFIVWYDMVCNYEQNCSRQYITICNTAIAPTDRPTDIDHCQPSHLFEAQGFHGCSHGLVKPSPKQPCTLQCS